MERVEISNFTKDNYLKENPLIIGLNLDVTEFNLFDLTTKRRYFTTMCRVNTFYILSMKIIIIKYTYTCIYIFDGGDDIVNILSILGGFFL
jgi:hypothetical protein